MITKRRIFLLITLSIFLACIISSGFFFWFSRDSIRVSPTTYEEIYSTETDLSHKLTDIDLAISRALYSSDSQEKDVFFLNIVPRHQNGHVWDFTDLLIKCHDAASAAELEEIITNVLTELGPEILLKKQKDSDGTTTYHVFAKGFYTHKIVLKFTGITPPMKDTRPKIAIIIDDMGYNSDMAFSFIHLDLPLTFSVLPYAPFTKIIIQEANQKGREVLLHLPMEPKNYPSVDPGPGSLFLTMDEQEIKQILDQDLGEILGAQGVNNHMGSSFTEDRDKMLIVLKELKRRQLFYIDSRTTIDTVAFETAKAIGLPVASRDVFLDNQLVAKAIKIQLERLLSIARHSGTAIGIAHPHKETLNTLEGCSAKLKEEFQIVPVSELVN
ncbi:MAG: divergent polysaccharide deacetylase family protein [Thermodesulfobacteriota bacterium]|nr:divergent polysaccharide deacetylase family protein [Thermodesulfobacteriota bacterium]